MNKTEFIKAVADKAELSAANAERAWNAAEEIIADALYDGDKVVLTGFGVFEARRRDARDGINPLTKEKIKIAASISPNFKAGKAFKDALNASGTKKK
jgi:DNA-binding protein HU-beta